VRRQPIQKPVLLSNLQMSIQGDATLMTDSPQGTGSENCRTRHARFAR
jgi:hypothetical protein